MIQRKQRVPMRDLSTMTAEDREAVADWLSLPRLTLARSTAVVSHCRPASLQLARL